MAVTKSPAKANQEAYGLEDVDTQQPDAELLVVAGVYALRT
jgi:hypothetical protein